MDKKTKKTFLRLLPFLIFLAPLTDFASATTQSAAFKLLFLPGTQSSSPELVKWGPPRLGEAARITYALAQKSIQPGIEIGDCRSVNSLAALSFGDPIQAAMFAEEIAEGFRIWEQVSGVQFFEVDDPELADVVVGVSDQSSSITHARVGLTRSTEREGGVASLKKAALCLDEDEFWTSDLFHHILDRQKFLSLRMVVAHEVGHILGLDHPRDKGQLMHPSIQEGMGELYSGDQEGAQILYGYPEI